MHTSKPCGFLIMDRKGEYIEDGLDQDNNRTWSMAHHPNAAKRMIVVSPRSQFARMQAQGQIAAFIPAQLNMQDIDPIDLVDFLPGLTPQQAALLSDYVHLDGFYARLLAETPFGDVDKGRWYHNFPGLISVKGGRGKQRLEEFAKLAAEEGRQTLNDEEVAILAPDFDQTSMAVMERAARRIKRFCLHPMFGGSARGVDILAAPSCVRQVLQYLERGACVFMDLRGRSDADYTLIAALFARRLLTENKSRSDAKQLRACLIMEEAHNILSESEISKGDGQGSVFVEFMREGRSLKLGLTLITQQPDTRSIDPQLAKTLDAVVAFAMSPEEARHLSRFKAALAGVENDISNAQRFQAIAIANGGPVAFQTRPVDAAYMRACATGSLEQYLQSRREASIPANTTATAPTAIIEDRLTRLMRQRQETIHDVALKTLHAWREPGPDDPSME